MSNLIFERFRRLSQHSKKVNAGHLASLPANYIDELDKEQNDTFFPKLVNFLKQRILYAFVFMPLLVTDCVSSLAIAVSLTLKAAFSKDPITQMHAENYRDHILNNFLALTFSWVGLLVSPKLISFYFIEKNLTDNQMISGGKLYVREVNLQKISPQDSTAKVAKIILDAKNKGLSVSIRGAGFSQGEQFLPESTPDKKAVTKQPIVIDLSDVNHVELLDKDSDAKVVKVGAGATWAQVQTFANQHEMAVKVMQASNVFSIGGSIGTNIHGWAHKIGTVANTIRAVTIVNAKGAINTYRRGENPEFNQVFGTFGLMGVVTEVELELTDNETLYERAVEVSPTDYLEKFEGVKADDNVRMHLYRLSLEQGQLLKTGLMVNYVKEDSKAPVVTPHLKQEGKKGRRYERVAINLMRRSHFVQSNLWRYEKKRLLTQTDEQASYTTNEIMQPVINAMLNGSTSETEWLQEYFVPGNNLSAFLNELGPLLDENNVHMINATVRFVKKDTISPLPYAPEDRFAVVICFNQILKPKEITKTERWVRLAANIAIKFDGAPYMPYQSFFSQKQYENAYGADKIAAFMADKKAQDPTGVLSNGMHHRYLHSIPQNRDNTFQTLMDSEENQTYFRDFLTNVLCRADADKFFALLKEVISYCDTYEEVYLKMQKRITEIMPGTFKDLGNILTSLTTIKTDLVHQASLLLGEGKRHIDGMLEIGYPGRFISEFQKKYTLKGKRFVMLEAESPTDYIQTGYPRPYNQAFNLDYANPIKSMERYLEKVGEHSVEVITCFVGLHHFPIKQLDGFLARVKRALKPGGQFLLVDHNIGCARDNLMANLAHSVFNIVTGETPENDFTELRNFQPMSYWHELCAKHGLDVSPVEANPKAMIRQGDPSQNQMCAFSKPQIKPKLRHLLSELEAPKLPDEPQVMRTYSQTKIKSFGNLFAPLPLIPETETVQGDETYCSNSTTLSA